jgi:hypothetical protein
MKKKGKERRNHVEQRKKILKVKATKGPEHRHRGKR